MSEIELKIGWLVWLIARKAKPDKPAKISTNVYLIRDFGKFGLPTLIRLSDGYFIVNAHIKNIAKTVDPHDPNFDPSCLPPKTQEILGQYLERDAENTRRQAEREIKRWGDR